MDTETLQKLRITRHAWKAMADRDVTPEEVVEILRRPSVVEPHQGRERYVGRKLVLVVAWEAGAPVLVTVLLRRGEQWTNSDAASR